MREFAVCIIGGGASGILAAISVRRSGGTCILLEKMPILGKKILASGNGRCNFLNEKLDESFYNSPARGLVRSAFSVFGKTDILDFFKSLGLYYRSEAGRIFPAANQSAAVLKVLELEFKRLSVPVEFNFNAQKIVKKNGGFTITAKSGLSFSCASVIMAGGGKSYPALGSDGSGYKLAENLGHTIIDPVPCCVPLLTKDPILQYLQGQKITAKLKSIIGGEVIDTSSGDLLFTKYGLSGTAVLDVSESVSIALNRKTCKEAVISADILPYLSAEELEKDLQSRRSRKIPAEDRLSGMLPNKLCRALNGFDQRKLKDWRFKITATRGWNEAEFTAGGVDTKEVTSGTLESRIVKGLYFAGEILDVNGKRGGYNLAWAWSSGFVAGMLK